MTGRAGGMRGAACVGSGVAISAVSVMALVVIASPVAGMVVGVNGLQEGSRGTISNVRVI